MSNDHAVTIDISNDGKIDIIHWNSECGEDLHFVADETGMCRRVRYSEESDDPVLDDPITLLEALKQIETESMQTRRKFGFAQSLF